VAHDRERVAQAAQGLRRLGIGGTAVGTGLNAHPDYPARMVQRLAALTGQELQLADNLFEAMQSMADVAAFSAALRTAAITLTRVANDFRLLASGPATGFDEIHLPAVQPGSSIMPGKVNPSLAEMLNMAMFHVMGCDHTVALASQAGQLELNVMMPVIAHALFESMQVFIGAVRAFTEKCVVGVTVNRDKAEGWLSKNAIVATALNPLIGYLSAAELVKAAVAGDLSIRDAARERIQQGTLRRKDDGRTVSLEEIDAVLGDVAKMTEGGIQAAGGGG
jgi:fumarate hydratase, class II